VIDEAVATNWYAGGLCFECRVCGRCCSGPGEGYIWVARPEIELIAKHLHLTPGELRRKYLRRVGLRTTIIEDELTRDCIFLQMIDGAKRCGIYAVRPAQCRSWPFWPENLASPDDWNRAAFRCPGVNFGRLYSGEEIERIRKNRRWWKNPTDAADSSRK
jgi:Fe-S-cluster containining protein